MNILILHRMGNPRFWLKAVAELELALPTYAPEHNYIVHNAWLPFPSYLKDINYHGIILGPTFLSMRYSPREYLYLLKEYEFLKDLDAVKIALPQDDYDCSAFLDQLVTDWHVDKVYTVCPEHWNLLYPNYLRNGGDLSLGYTGYITPDLIHRSQNPICDENRIIDVSYRSKILPPNFGRLGVTKGEIGIRFKEAFRDKGLKMDISVEIKHVIPGSQWLDFLENSRFTLGSNSGSSLLDPKGEIRDCIKTFIKQHPGAEFEEVEAHCFPGQEGKYVFTAISPRVFEAGMLKTGQIMVPGPYSGILEPWEHYIPLQEDCSNVSEIMDAINDTDYMQKMKSGCKEKLLAEPKLRIGSYVLNILKDIHEGVQKRNIHSNSEKFLKAAIRYRRQSKILTPLKKSFHDAKMFVGEHMPFIEKVYTAFRD